MLSSSRPLGKTPELVRSIAYGGHESQILRRNDDNRISYYMLPSGTLITPHAAGLLLWELASDSERELT